MVPSRITRRPAKGRPWESSPPGTRPPHFTLPDQDGKPVSLRDFAGRQVVVYFYPRDDTPGCTKEACQFNDNLAAFKRAKVPVLGHLRRHRRQAPGVPDEVRTQVPAAHRRRPRGREAYGAWGEKTLYGKKTIGVIRSTFLVAADGTIARAWYHVKADGHAAKVLEEADRLT